MKQLFLLYNGEKHFYLLARKRRTQLLFVDREREREREREMVCHCSSSRLRHYIRVKTTAIVHNLVGVKSQQTVLMMIHQVLSRPVFHTVSTRMIDSQTIHVRVVGSTGRSTNPLDSRSQLELTLRLCGCTVPKRS